MYVNLLQLLQPTPETDATVSGSSGTAEADIPEVAFGDLLAALRGFVSSVPSEDATDVAEAGEAGPGEMAPTESSSEVPDDALLAAMVAESEVAPAAMPTGASSVPMAPVADAAEVIVSEAETIPSEEGAAMAGKASPGAEVAIAKATKATVRVNQDAVRQVRSSGEAAPAATPDPSGKGELTAAAPVSFRVARVDALLKQAARSGEIRSVTAPAETHTESASATFWRPLRTGQTRSGSLGENRPVMRELAGPMRPQASADAVPSGLDVNGREAKTPAIAADAATASVTDKGFADTASARVATLHHQEAGVGTAAKPVPTKVDAPLSPAALAEASPEVAVSSVKAETVIGRLDAASTPATLRVTSIATPADETGITGPEAQAIRLPESGSVRFVQAATLSPADAAEPVEATGPRVVATPVRAETSNKEVTIASAAKPATDSSVVTVTAPHSSTEASAAKAEAPRMDAPKAEATKAEVPRAEVQRAEATKAEVPKAEVPKAEVPKAAVPEVSVPSSVRATAAKSGVEPGSVPLEAEEEAGTVVARAERPIAKPAPQAAKADAKPAVSEASNGAVARQLASPKGEEAAGQEQAKPEAIKVVAARLAPPPGKADVTEARGTVLAREHVAVERQSRVENAPVAPVSRADGVTVRAADSVAPSSGVPLPETSAPRVSLETLGEETVRQVKSLLAGGGQRVRVRLVPESLGELHVEVHSHKGEVSVRLVSASAVVREALDIQVPGLRDALTRDGVNLSRVDVSANMASDSGSSSGSMGRDGSQQADAPRMRQQAALAPHAYRGDTVTAAWKARNYSSATGLNLLV